MSNKLRQLAFLVGKWNGRSEDQFGEKGVIETSTTFEYDLGGNFIIGRGESRKGGKVENQSLSVLMFDARLGKFVRKSAFSYGWLNNEIGDWNGDRLVFDVVSIDGEPDYFRGMKWRSFVHKYSEDEIGLGLEASKNSEPFRLYGESREKRVKS